MLSAIESLVWCLYQRAMYDDCYEKSCMVSALRNSQGAGGQDENRLVGGLLGQGGRGAEGLGSGGKAGPGL